MFKTAKNTIKKAAKDQVEFFLVLLTGVFAGSVFTLAYVRFWEKGDATFADIGGVLAGTATVGLLCLALKAKDEWHTQNKISLKQSAMIELQDLLNNYFNKGILYSFSIINLREAIEKHTKNGDIRPLNSRIEELQKEDARLWDDFINLAGKINTKIAIYKAIYQASPPSDLTLEHIEDKVSSMLDLGTEMNTEDFTKLMIISRQKSEKAFINEFNKIFK